jgi:hypothetical protein
LRKTGYEPWPRKKSAFGDARGREGAANPNGSVNNIAGIYSENFNVLGLMVHPENLIDPLVSGTDVSGLFESLRRFAIHPESGKHAALGAVNETVTKRL